MDRLPWHEVEILKVGEPWNENRTLTMKNGRRELRGATKMVKSYDRR